MKYVIEGYKTHEEFATDKEAKVYFDTIKNNFTYCELKKVEENGIYYYAESIEIFRK